MFLIRDAHVRRFRDVRFVNGFAELPQAAMPGDDLLFQRLSVSTIGAVRFHGRVRDGIGWGTDAMVTRQWSLRMFLIDAYHVGAAFAAALTCQMSGWRIVRPTTLCLTSVSRAQSCH